MTEQPAPDPAASSGRTCPWCGAQAADGVQQCAACGAALAQRESIGDLRIPGLTSVDPALEDYDKRPLHLTGPSPTQGMAPALIVGAVAGGPIGLVAIGGVAAVAAAEYMGAGRGAGSSARPEDVGKPSEVVLQALDRLADRPEARDAQPDAGEPGEPEPTLTPAGDGRDVWRDLPIKGSETTDEAHDKHEEQPDGR